MQSERKIHADINQARDGWIQVTLSGEGAADLTEKQIEAALSAAEPRGYLVHDKDNPDGRYFKHKPSIADDDMSEYEVWIEPLYAAPPAPSVAVKALPDMPHILKGCVDMLKSNGFGSANIVEVAERALSAQVQDAREPIPQNKETLDQVAAIMLQHGTPAQRSEAIAYAFDAQVQAVEVDRSTDIRKAGLKARDELLECMFDASTVDNDLAEYMERIIDACVRAAARAKQEGGHD